MSGERPSNRDIVNAIDWMHGDGEDLEFDSAFWGDVDETGVVRVEGFVHREDGRHYVAAKWKLLEVDYNEVPYDDDEWDLP